MSRFVRELAVFPFTPATNFKTNSNEGYLVTISGDTATLSASASGHANGVILDPEDTDGKASIGILGGNLGPCRVRAGGAIAKGAKIQQGSDGRVVTDAGSGARVIVGIALEAAAAAGVLIECVLKDPISLS